MDPLRKTSFDVDAADEFNEIDNQLPMKEGQSMQDWVIHIYLPYYYNVLCYFTYDDLCCRLEVMIYDFDGFYLFIHPNFNLVAPP